MENIPSSNFTGELQNASDNLDTFLPITELVISIIVVLVGVPGNCLILRVYWNKIRKASTDILIMALAWADLSVCVLRLFIIVVILLLLAKVDVQQVYDKSRPFQQTLICFSVIITTIIAVDRYDCICRPQRRLFTSRRAKIAALVAMGLAIIASVQEFLNRFDESHEASCKNTSGNVTLLLGFCAVLTVIGICYGKVFATIRRHVRVGARQQNHSKQDIAMLTRPPVVASQGPSELQSTADDGAVSTISAPKLRSPNLASKGNAVNRNSTCQGPSLSEIFSTKGTTSETPHLAVSRNRIFNQGPAEGRGHAPQRVGAASLQRKTTKMLFITSVVFLLTWLSYMVRVLLLTVAPNCGSNINPTVLELSLGSSAIFYTNNSVNPLIYGLANSRFRKECKKVLSESACGLKFF